MEQFDTCRTSRDEDWWGVGFWWLGDSHHTTSPATTDWAMPDWPVFCITGTIASQKPQDMRQMGYDLCISLFPPAHTHTQLMAQRAKSPAALPPPLPLWWTVSDSATNPKELETHPTTHQAACQSPQQFDLTSQFLFISTQLFPRFSLAPTKLRTHFHKNYPTIAWLGVQPWTWERERAKDLLINGQDWTFTTRHCVCLFFFLKIQQKVK